jgi:hypothetical protein
MPKKKGAKEDGGMTNLEIMVAAFLALQKAKETIKAFHGDVGWEIYNKKSPEMKQINEAIEYLNSYEPTNN